MRDFLSHDVRKELELRHDAEHDLHVADRIKAILLADSGWMYKDIAEALRFVSEYLDRHKLRPENGGSHPSSMNPKPSRSSNTSAMCQQQFKTVPDGGAKTYHF